MAFVPQHSLKKVYRRLIAKRSKNDFKITVVNGSSIVSSNSKARKIRTSNLALLVRRQAK